MVKVIFISIAAILCCNAFSQSYDNNWVFGDSAGLNFSTPIPNSFNSVITSHEACASISDSLGNLLFYTNGRNVWNRNNEIMPNGDSLQIGGVFGLYESSTTQGVTIIPRPGFINQFYVLIIASKDPNYGLEYSLVDMDLDGGYGDVVEKNQDIFEGYLDEKLQAVKHGNGQDWWVFCKLTVDNDTTFYLARFLVSSSGIYGPDTIEITSLVDKDIAGTGQIGQLKFSRDGNKMAFTRGIYFLIFDFDRCSGELSNMEEINANDGAYGCEFSPDGRLIYLTGIASIGKLVQFCLSCPEPIEDTKQVIFDNPYDNFTLGQIMCGPDNKIYIPISTSDYVTHLHTEINVNISVIINPNVQGLLCDFDTLTISVIPGRCTGALPNMPNYNLGPLAGSECDTLGTTINTFPDIRQEFSIYPNPATSQVFISGNEEHGNDVDLFVYNMQGEKIYQQTDVTINSYVKLPELPAGIYEFALFIETNKVYSGKITIVQ